MVAKLQLYLIFWCGFLQASASTCLGLLSGTRLNCLQGQLKSESIPATFSLSPQTLTDEAPCDAQLQHLHTVFTTAAVFKEHERRSECILLQGDLQDQTEPASRPHVMSGRPHNIPMGALRGLISSSLTQMPRLPPPTQFWRIHRRHT